MLKNTNNSIRFLIFILGILATLAYRFIVVLNQISPFWVDVAWYTGTIGFIIHFIYRWYIENKRDKLIEDLGLTEKIRSGKKLTKQDREAITYVLEGVENSWAKWNYITIFIASAGALVYAVLVALG